VASRRRRKASLIRLRELHALIRDEKKKGNREASELMGKKKKFPKEVGNLQARGGIRAREILGRTPDHAKLKGAGSNWKRDVRT